MRFLMYIVTILTYISYIPQIVKLIKDKRSEGISINSWILWGTSSFLSIIYAFYLQDLGLILADCSELILELIILILSVKYKKRKIINLCGVDLEFGDEWLLLNTVVSSMETSDEEVYRIAKSCNIIAVLKNIETSENPLISERTREYAKSKYEDLWLIK